MCKMCCGSGVEMVNKEVRAPESTQSGTVAASETQHLAGILYQKNRRAILFIIALNSGKEGLMV